MINSGNYTTVSQLMVQLILIGIGTHLLHKAYYSYQTRTHNYFAAEMSKMDVHGRA